MAENPLGGISRLFGTAQLRKFFSPAGAVGFDVPQVIQPVINLDPRGEPPFHTKQPWSYPLVLLTPDGVHSWVYGIDNPANSGLYVVIRRAWLQTTVTKKVQLLYQYPSLGQQNFQNSVVQYLGIDPPSAPQFASTQATTGIVPPLPGAILGEWSVPGGILPLDLGELHIPVPPGFSCFFTQDPADVLSVTPYIGTMMGDVYTPPPVST
jgi:hypothetical protein